MHSIIKIVNYTKNSPSKVLKGGKRRNFRLVRSLIEFKKEKKPQTYLLKPFQVQVEIAKKEKKLVSMRSN